MLKLITFGLLCAAALVVAAYAREDRRCVMTVAGIVATNWVLFAMPWIYNPASPAHLMKVIGFPALHQDMWSIADLASIILLAVCARHLWWSHIIAAAYLITLGMLAVATHKQLDYDQYAMVMDAALVVQLAVIFMLGGGGFADRLLAHWSTYRVHLLGRGSVAHKEEAPR